MNRGEGWEGDYLHSGNRKGEMADSNFWRDMEAQFRALDPSGSLGVRCHYKAGNLGKWDWQIIGAGDGSRLNFERLARLVGSALDADCDKDALQLWLDTLRKISPNIEYDDPIGGDIEAHVSGRIRHICEESANLCVRLDIGAFEAERRHTPTTWAPETLQAENNALVRVEAATEPKPEVSIGPEAIPIIVSANSRSPVPQFPERALWLHERLLERGWSTSDPYSHRGPDRKTVEKILRGEKVRNDVLEKLAEALSKKHGKVKVLDIPQT